ncbi:hypothetical protein P43SY_007325 [Pythium insidiosum]|uniref:Glutamine cyclotransferase n=1 Tax=Pythium insidiosum TaxID=114742 RepID=A0AAD5MFB6_PYTIN|nr:hypothetical protein P43SY_007325 [Pythium insidiosum]
MTRPPPLAGLLLTLALLSVESALRTSASTRVRVIAVHPHNASMFTEGLFVLDGAIVESTGLDGQSLIRQYRLARDALTPEEPADHAREEEEDGDDVGDDDDAALSEVEKEFRFSPEIFGEGIACIGDKLYALTYKHQTILVLARDTFKLLESHPFETTTGEGWGMTTDGRQLIVSDGSATIAFYDPAQGFRRVRSIEVKRDGKPVPNVNELEYVDGQLLANVWFTNDVLRIDARTGAVLETIDLTWLAERVDNVSKAPAQVRKDAVMNGIAFDPQTRHVFLTGKLWDSMFEVSFSTLARRKKSTNGKRKKERGE